MHLPAEWRWKDVERGEWLKSKAGVAKRVVRYVLYTWVIIIIIFKPLFIYYYYY